LNISYGKRVKKHFDNASAIKKKYGNISKAISKRISDIIAAPNLESMKSLPGKTHELSGDRDGQLAISVSGNYRIIFIPDHDPIPLVGHGGLDWSLVTHVEIIEIVDYHS